jgi:hypothetical protein
MAKETIKLDEEPRCLYCGKVAGYYKNPNYTVDRPKMFCKTKCGMRHRLGYNYNEVKASKIPVDVLLDPEDRERAIDYLGDVLRRRWRYHNNGSGYIITTIDKKLVFLHRFLLGVGDDNSINVVHLNGDRKDCRKANLQIMSQEEHNIWHNTKITQDVIVEGVSKKKMSIDTKNGIKEVFFDPDDWDTIKIYRWGIKASGRWTDYAQAGVHHPDGDDRIAKGRYVRDGKEVEYTYSTARTTQLMMHRLVKGFSVVSKETDIHIDHIDGNGLNNCKDNLRTGSPQQNSRNKKTYSVSTGAIPYTGVKFRSDYARLIKQGEDASHIKNPYISSIGGKSRKYLGCFPTAEQAAQAYDNALCKHWEVVSPERQLNFPERYDEYMADLEKNTEKITDLSGQNSLE